MSVRLSVCLSVCLSVNIDRSHSIFFFSVERQRQSPQCPESGGTSKMLLLLLLLLLLLSFSTANKGSSVGGREGLCWVEEAGWRAWPTELGVSQCFALILLINNTTGCNHGLCTDFTSLSESRSLQ